MANLPASVRALAEQVPAEDLALDIVRSGLPDIEVVSQIRKNQEFPVIMVRRLPTFIDFGNDERFLASVDIAIHAFAQDPDGDRDAAIISEAARVVLRNAWLDHYYNPDLGSVTWFEVLAPPRRVSDWATASGPVQYADLPSNVWRYEARYRLVVRKPRALPFALP
jgi:hypothetical protein